MVVAALKCTARFSLVLDLDHTREYVPLLVTGAAVSSPVGLGTRESFADIGATVEEALGLQPSGPGRSFLREVTS